MTRTAAYLAQRGTDASTTEWEAYDARKAALLAKLDRAHTAMQAQAEVP